MNAKNYVIMNILVQFCVERVLKIYFCGPENAVREVWIETDEHLVE